ncbi:MAG: Ig-like domain-containing protein, partial [Myxococcota bacterium]
MMLRKILSLFVVLLLAGGMSACAGCDDDGENNDNNVDQDTGMDVEVDTGMDVEEDTEMDVEEDTGDDATDAADTTDTEDDTTDVEDDTADADAGTVEPDPAASDQIETVLGGTNATIEQVAVTYTKPNVGGDAAGFFVQAEQTGPALFVEVDPTAVDPDIVAGDILTFDVTGTDEVDGLSKATSIENIDYLGSGYDVSQLAQDVTDATDLVSALDDYTAELLTADVEVVDDFGFAGGGHEAAQVETAGVTGNADLLFRAPSDFVDTYGLQNTCTLTVGPTPMWRFNADAQLSAYAIEDISNVNCPAPTVTEAVATSATEVEVTFNRALDDTTVAETEFTIEDDGGAGLNVTGATVSDNVVTLTTDAQTEGTSYTVTVSDNVLDVFGSAVDQAANTADFLGYAPAATVVINELSATADGNCDLVELRVTEGGSMTGFEFYENDSSVLTFDGLIVQKNDYVIIHADEADCNTNGATNETAAPDEQSNANFPENYDSAYDWWSSENSFGGVDRSFWLADASGDIQDFVTFAGAADASACTGYDATNSAVTVTNTAAGAGEWVADDGSALSGLSEEEYCENAVYNFTGTDT